MRVFKIFFTAFIISLAFLSLSASVEAKTIKFAVASDAHYSLYPSDNPERKLFNAPKALNGFVARANENDYDFIIFLGDNINKSNKENLTSFLKIVSQIKRTPYYLVMGNHDVHKISGLSKPEYLEIVSKNSRYQRKAENSYCFCPTNDIVVIVLDGVSSGMPSAHGIFNKKTLKWLDNTLAKNSKKQAIIFQHVPFYEPYFSNAHGILDKAEYTAVLRKHKNILMVVSGHYHKEFKITDDYGVTHIGVPALFNEPFDYMEIKVEYDKKFLQPAAGIKTDTTLKPAV